MSQDAIAPVKAFFNQLREEQLQGKVIYRYDLKNRVSFSPKVMNIGELSLDRKAGSKPSFSTYLYFDGTLPEEPYILDWYIRSEDKKKALTYSYKPELLKKELDLGVLAINKVAKIRFSSTEKDYLEYKSNFVSFIEDAEQKDTDPSDRFVALLAGGITEKSKVERAAKVKEIAQQIGMMPLVHHGKEVEGAWMKLGAKGLFGGNLKGLLGDYARIAELLGGGVFTLELRNADVNSLPRFGKLVGLKLETADELHDKYRIWLDSKSLNIYMSLYEKDMAIVMELLAYYGFQQGKQQQPAEQKKGEPKRANLPLIG